MKTLPGWVARNLSSSYSMKVRSSGRPESRGLVGLQVEHQGTVFDEVRAGAPTGPPEHVGQPGVELLGLPRGDAEVIEEVFAQLELSELGAGYDQQQRRHRQIPLAHRPAQGERRLRIDVGADDGAGPSLVRFDPFGGVSRSGGLPGVAGQVEGLSQGRRGRIGEEKQRLHSEGPRVLRAR